MHFLDRHPCFGGKGGRIHLPVSPECNIRCGFCAQGISKNNNLPGNTMKVISPNEALGLVDKAVKICKEITVVGIAGPGDTLASNHAIETFRLINQSHPNLIKCISTNGLLLLEKLEDLLKVHIGTVTVTINSIDPLVQSKINNEITYLGNTYYGEEAAEILIHNQLQGIKALIMEGVIVKVNTVLIPEINMEYVENIAKIVASLGVNKMNIIPLIPKNKFACSSAPSCNEIEAVRNKVSKYISVFTKCQMCRADAVGVPGKTEFRKEVYGKKNINMNYFSHG